MKKGKTQALVVLAVEIASIAVLHAVKLNQTGRNPVSSNKETSRTVSALQPETKMRSSFSLAAFR